MKILLFVFLAFISHPALAQTPSWQAASGLPGSAGHLALADDGDLFFATTASRFDFDLLKVVFETKIYRSTDNGATFTQQGGIVTEGFNAVTALEAIDGEIWMAGEGLLGAQDADWFYRSTDDGLTWTSSGSGDDAFRGISLMRKADGEWWAGGGNRVYNSTDSGATWQLTSGYPQFDEIDGRRFYHRNGKLDVSDNMGATFTTVLAAGPNLYQNVLKYDGEIYTATGRPAPIVSTDGGDTWTEDPAIPGFTNPQLQNIYHFDEKLIGWLRDQTPGGGPRLIFSETGTEWGELEFPGSVTDPNIEQAFISGDRFIIREGAAVHFIDLGSLTGAPAIKFQPPSEDLPIGEPTVLRVYATGARPLTYQWYEGAPGNTSSPIAGATCATHRIDSLDTSLDYWVRITNAEGSIDSDGATANAQEVWQRLERAPGIEFDTDYGPVSSPLGLKVFDYEAELVFTSNDDGVTWDNGVTWPIAIFGETFKSAFRQKKAIITFQDGLFHLVRRTFGDNGQYATSSDGVTWTLRGDLPADYDPEGFARQGDLVLVSLLNTQGMARSLDGGATFTFATNGITNRTSKVQILDNGNAVALGGGDTLVTSSDQGNTWTERQLLPGTKQEYVTSLFNDGVNLYAAVDKFSNIYEGDGLFKSTDGGVTWTQIAYAGTNLNFVTFVDGKLVVGNDSSPPAFFISEDDGGNFTSLSTNGLQAFTFLEEPVVSGGNLFLPSSTIFWLKVGSVATGAPPIITTQPIGATIAPGSSVTLTVEASGEGILTYQWFNGALPVGSNQPTFTTDPAIDYVTSYSVEVSNGFGSPARSDIVTVDFIPVPEILDDLKPAAYFVGDTGSYGPSFSFTTPADTVYQWYRGASGDTSSAIAGATGRTISIADLIPGEPVWLRATANGVSVESSAAAFTAMTCDPVTIDVISRDPDGRTWNEGANSFMAEQGNFALMGFVDPGEDTARFPLPYAGFTPLLDNGTPIGGTPNDISNDGRFHLIGNGTVYDFDTQTLTPTYNSALTIEGDNAEQIGTSGRYILMRTAHDELVAGDDNDHVDLVLHDRTTGTFAGITAPANQSIGATLPAEMNEAESEVYFSHFATDPLVPSENGNLYIYDIATGSLSVPAPAQGKGPYSMFLDASSNGRFLLFMWNPQIVALRESEPRNLTAPRQHLYVYDRVEDELSYLNTPFPPEYTSDHTISNDGQTVSFIHWGANLLQPHVAHRVPNDDLWAVKLLIPPPTFSRTTADLQMSDSGDRFIYSTFAWSLQAPQYATGSGSDLNEVNVMLLEGAGAQVFMPANYDDWTNSELPAAPAADQLPSADPDGDGVINYFEFLSARSPSIYDASPLIGSISGTFTYRERADAPVRFTPEFTESLQTGSWTNATGSVVSRIEVEPGIIEVTLSTSSLKGFFRLSAPTP